MSKFNKGILGGFSGKTGTVVGSNWKGRSVMRSLPVKSKKRASQFQLEQREKFKLMVAFLSDMSELFNLTFQSQGSTISGLNAALSYNIQNAIIGDTSPFSIDYTRVLVSKGNLPGAAKPKVTLVGDAGIEFSWSDNSGAGKAKVFDKVILVVHCPALTQSIYFTDGATRGELMQLVDASVFAGEKVETWMVFQAEDGTAVSKSNYTGSLYLLS